MFGIITFIVAVLMFAMPVMNYLNDALLFDAEKKRLKERFENWWLVASDLDGIQLSLAIIRKIDQQMDVIFGSRLISKLAVRRSMVISSTLLVASLSIFGLLTHRKFGVEPWYTYQQNIGFLDSAIELMSVQKTNAIALVKNTPPSVGSNEKVQLDRRENMAKTSSNAVQNIPASQTVTNGLVDIKAPNNQADIVVGLDQDTKFLKALKDTFDRSGLKLTYCFVFLSVLLLTNGILFFVAVVCGRIVVKEVAASGRLFTTLSLFFTNFSFILILSSAFLLFLIIVSAPLLLFLIPLLAYSAKISVLVPIILVSNGSLAAWAFAAASLKLVVLIAFLPGCFTVLVSLVASIAIRWKNAFHLIVGRILLRCAEMGPLAFLIATFIFVSAVVGTTGFLINKYF